MTTNDDRIIRELRQRLDEAEETICQLKEEVKALKNAKPSFEIPQYMKLTAKEHCMVELLLTKAPLCVTKWQFMLALYPNEIDRPDIKIVDVFICKLRAKLRAYDVDILTDWGKGYCMPTESAQRLQALIEAHKRAPDEPLAVVAVHGHHLDNTLSVSGDICTHEQMERAVAAMRAAGEDLFGKERLNG